MNQTLLEIKNLEASIENKQIIKNFNLTINKMKFMSSWVQMVQVKVLSQNFGRASSLQCPRGEINFTQKFTRYVT
jgi:hypothetical protein